MKKIGLRWVVVLLVALATVINYIDRGGNNTANGSAGIKNSLREGAFLNREPLGVGLGCAGPVTSLRHAQNAAEQ